MKMARSQSYGFLLRSAFVITTVVLGSAEVRAALHSADSLAWSYAARKQGRNPNDWREARRFLHQITAQDQPAPRPLERLAA